MARAKQPPKPKKKGKKRVSVGRLFVALGITSALAIVCALIGYMVIIYNGQKIFHENKDKMEMMEASIILDGNNQEVGVLARENRVLVTKDQIPPLVANAFIATEDRRFEQHAGVDFWAIGRALVKDVIARSAVEGGSTITQQLAKNLFLNADKTFFRKGTEMAIALALEENLEKDEILTLYLNRIFFGSTAYGIQSAAKVYFNKSDLNELELWEIATLAAIPKAPSHYSPLRNPERSKERRAVVLKLMYDQGYITEAEKNAAQAVDYEPPAGRKQEHSAFMDYVIKEAEEQYNLEEEVLRRGGFKIYTTLNADAQRIMDQAFNDPKNFQKDGPEQKMQGSMVIVDNATGGIVAMSGGRDYVVKGLNRTLVQRQPGSSFKPLIAFAPAIEQLGLNPYSKLPDQQRDYNGYSPRNYDGVYRGEVDMYEAVRKSINAPAVWLVNELKPRTARAFVAKMGIELDAAKDNNLAIALGGLTNGVTPLQMAQAYTAFPNNGMMATAHSIRMIVDKDDHELKAKADKKKVMSPKTAYYMTELMKGVVDGGTGTAAKLKRPTAGKTGTTQLALKGLEKNNRDVWFVGYTPEWTAAVWMGFDKTDRQHYVLPSSGSLPAKMFKEVMNKAMANMKVTQFVKPEGVADLKEPPKSVTNLVAEYMADTRKVRLSWTGEATSEIGAYRIYRKEAKESDFREIHQTVQDTYDFNDLAVLPGETYEYYVVPVNPQSNLTGERSNSAVVVIPEEESAAPTENPVELPVETLEPPAGTPEPVPTLPEVTLPPEQVPTDPVPSNGGGASSGGLDLGLPVEVIGGGTGTEEKPLETVSPAP